MIVLGIHAAFSGTTHDPGACIVVNGVVVAAIEEERLNRIKTSTSFFPSRSVQRCLEIAGVNIRQVDLVASDGITHPTLEKKIARCLYDSFGFSPPINLIDHSTLHVLGSFLSSGFESALSISVDGYGDGLATRVSTFEFDDEGVVSKDLYVSPPELSLGAFYTAFTNYLGFRSIEGEYKVMGMAAYGQPKYDLKDFIAFDLDVGGLVCNTREPVHHNDYYSSIIEPSYNADLIYEYTGVHRPVHCKGRFESQHFDLAASVQKAFLDAYFGLVSYWRNKTGVTENLCLSGGCALNCLANKEFLRVFDSTKIFVMPASSDRGLPLGAALAASKSLSEKVVQDSQCTPVSPWHMSHFNNAKIFRLHNL